jgi:hypothetical protein
MILLWDLVIFISCRFIRDSAEIPEYAVSFLFFCFFCCWFGFYTKISYEMACCMGLIQIVFTNGRTHAILQGFCFFCVLDN